MKRPICKWLYPGAEPPGGDCPLTHPKNPFVIASVLSSCLPNIVEKNKIKNSYSIETSPDTNIKKGKKFTSWFFFFFHYIYHISCWIMLRILQILLHQSYKMMYYYNKKINSCNFLLFCLVTLIKFLPHQFRYYYQLIFFRLISFLIMTLNPTSSKLKSCLRCISFICAIVS